MSTALFDSPVLTQSDRRMLREDPIMAALLSQSPFGADGAGGYGTEGDIVYTTNDNVDLNMLWEEAQQAVSIWNQARSKLVSLLTFPVTNAIEEVPQVGEATFEEASEFGVPEGERLKLGYFQLGFDFKDYDRATRFTWKALRDMDARQVRSATNALISADERLVFRKVMEAIFDNNNRETDIRNNPYPVYPLYNADGTVPPSYGDNDFDSAHNHYLVTNHAVIDSGDLEDAYDHLQHHGYSIENGTQIVCLMNRNQIKEVRKFRMGVENNNTVEANYDFVPARSQPAQFLDSPLGLIGTLPPDFWNGLKVSGSYDDIVIIEQAFIPDGYFLMFGAGGAGNLQNLVGLREHSNPVYRGLRIMPGRDAGYPLVDSFFARAFGTGVRQRGGAVVTQIKVGAANSYVAPEKYTRTPNELVA